MQTYVFADVIFIENFIMNYIILWSTAKFIRLKQSKLKFSVAAALGAVYAIMAYFPQYKFMFTLVMKIIFPLIMIIIAYTPSHFKEFIKVTEVFYIISCIFGGASFGLFYFINGLNAEKDGIFYIGWFPVKLLIGASVIAYIFVKYCWDYIQYRVKRERVLTEMKISLDDKYITITSLVDTGNSLSDPITKLPVVVAEYGALKELLPVDIQKIFEENKEDNLHAIARIMSHSEWVTRFKVIPFKSLGKENGMLIGFKPDSVFIDDTDKSVDIKNIIIGIYNKRLSSDGEYRALIHPDILGEGS